MATRKTIPLSVKIEVLAEQATCNRCRTTFGKAKNIEWHHLYPVALGGENTPENLIMLCKGCHAFITDGPPATSAGSTKQVIAKMKRLTKPKEKSKHNWPHNKLPYRPFPKKKPPI